MRNFCVGLLVAIVGCGSGDKKGEGDKRSNTDKSATGGKEGRKSEGEPKLTGAPLPKDLAADVPVYPHGHIKTVTPAPLSIVMTTPHELPDVYAHCVKAMSERGWKEVLKGQDKFSFTIHGEKAGRTLTIGGMKEAAGTEITIGVR